MDAHNENRGSVCISENEQTVEQEQESIIDNNIENCDKNCPSWKYQGLTRAPRNFQP